MKKIREKAKIIWKSRVYAICKIIAPTMQLELFEEEKDDFIDVLQAKSCGLFCGK